MRGGKPHTLATLDSLVLKGYHCLQLVPAEQGCPATHALLAIIFFIINVMNHIGKRERGSEVGASSKSGRISVIS